MVKINEVTLVKHVENFIKDNRNDMAYWNNQLLKAKVDNYVRNNIQPTDQENSQLLTNALMIQAMASRTLLQNSRGLDLNDKNFNRDFIILPDYYHPWGYGWAVSESGDSSFDGDGALIVLGFVAVCSVACAAYGLAKDLFESTEEIFNNQRVVANLAVLAVSTALISAAAIGAFALIVSNPGGWAIAGAAVITLTVALMVKGFRAFAKSIDASLEHESALATDSRFFLSPQEIIKLKGKGYDDEDIDKIKAIIRGLAIKAKSTDETGIFATKDRYKEIVNALMDVKKGNIDPNLQKQYGIKKPNQISDEQDSYLGEEPLGPVG